MSCRRLWALSSEAQTFVDAVGRLYGYSLSNTYTAVDAWVHIYEKESGGVTFGTNSATINMMIPFGGGRNADFTVGMVTSSGMSVTASLSAQSASHDASLRMAG